MNTEVEQVTEAQTPAPNPLYPYIRMENGELVMDPKFDQDSRTMYYSGRLFYDGDNRFPAGRYNSDGSTVRFNRWYVDNAASGT
jgi:hypothetical protein